MEQFTNWKVSPSCLANGKISVYGFATQMKAPLATGLSAWCVFFGLIVTMLQYPFAVNCGTKIICTNVVKLPGPLIMVAGLIGLAVSGLINRDGKII